VRASARSHAAWRGGGTRCGLRKRPAHSKPPTPADAPADPDNTVTARLDGMTEGINTFFLTSAGALVFVMHAGFAMVRALCLCRQLAQGWGSQGRGCRAAVAASRGPLRTHLPPRQALTPRPTAAPRRRRPQLCAGAIRSKNTMVGVCSTRAVPAAAAPGSDRSTGAGTALPHTARPSSRPPLKPVLVSLRSPPPSPRPQNILLQTVLDAAVSGLAWYLVGWAFAYGDVGRGNPFIGDWTFALTQWCAGRGGARRQRRRAERGCRDGSGGGRLSGRRRPPQPPATACCAPRARRFTRPLLPAP
jgi:hypothetical protein